MKKIAVFSALILLSFGVLIAVPVIRPAHAQTNGTVCIIPNSASSCGSVPATITGTVGSQLKVSVFMQNSTPINGFDITLLADHTILKPAGADLNGTILPGPQTVLVECLSGVLVHGNVCPPTDTVDTLHFAAVACSGCGLSLTNTGLLFHAIYNVTGRTTGTSLAFQTGCGTPTAPTSHPPLCVTISNGAAGPVPENVQTATFMTSAATPSISTTLSSTTIAVGLSVFDNATLQGATSGAGGTVSYAVFTNGICSALGNVVSVVTVTNGAVPGSRRVFFNSSGTFSWQAMYSGDSSNNGASSPCEPLTVCKCAPTITTTLSATTINLGGSVSDSATLSGTFQATGTVTYSLFSTGTCSGTSNTVSIVTVTNNVVPSSRSVTFNSAGSFSWNAIYSGDANNNGATSACEPMSVVSPDFAMTATPSSLTIIAGSSGTSTITLTSLNGFNGTVSLSTSPPPLCPQPQCSTWSISPTSVALSPNGRANATLTIFAGTQAFAQNITVFGNSGSLSHSVTVTFKAVIPDFTITASPSSQSVARGASTSFTITVKGTNGFNGTVSLSATISPNVHHGPTASLPSTVGPYSTSTLTVSTLRNTPTGMYTVTVTATSGLLTHTVTVTVIVTH